MKKLWLILLPLLIGLLWFFFHVDITCSFSKDNRTFSPIHLPFTSSSAAHNYLYKCHIDAKISQTARLHIIVDDEIRAISLNNKPIDISSLKERYHLTKLDDWRYGYDFDIPLQKGSNVLMIATRNYGGPYGISIQQKPLWWQAALAIGAFVSLFILLYLLVYDTIISFTLEYTKLIPFIPFFILCIGIVLRIIYILKTNQYSYSHDVNDHKELIRYYATHFFSLPQPDKGVEYPQQPLYYWISAIIYKIGLFMHLSQNAIFSLLRWVSFFYSLLWLFFGFLVAKILFDNKTLLRAIFMIFLACTPYFIFQSGQINNDTLNALLGMASFYAIIRFTLQQKFFIFATLAISLAILTKISSLLWALYFALILLYKKEKKRLLVFSNIVLALFLWTLWRVYIPLDGFHFVNSGLYANQTIPSLDLFYLFSFHPIELLHAAQSYVFGNDTIRFSFPTYMYGTMLFGEYDFSHFFTHPLFKLLSQLIILLGFVYIIGFLGYFLFFKRLTLFQKSFFIPFLINLVLILKFLLTYPSVCNSDFRYFSPTYGVIAAIFVLGLFHIMRQWRWTRKWIILNFSLLFVIEVVWLTMLSSWL